MNFKKITNNFITFKPVAFVVGVSKKIVIPGFDGVSLYNVASFFFERVWCSSLTTRASALSFVFFLALFPAIIFFFTLIPYIPITGFQDTLLATLKDILPEDTYNAALTTLEDIIKREHGGLLSLGFVASLYLSTSGISGIITAFNDSINATETRSFIKKKIVSLLLVFIMSVLIIVAISLFTAGSGLMNYLVDEGYLQSSFTYYSLIISEWLVIITLCFLFISSLYHFAPARHIRFRFVSAGSTLATFLFIITSLGFNFYISHFSQYNKLYGSIGALIIILMWIYINAIVLLVGFELNVSISNAKNKEYINI